MHHVLQDMKSQNFNIFSTRLQGTYLLATGLAGHCHHVPLSICEVIPGGVPDIVGSKECIGVKPDPRLRSHVGIICVLYNSSHCAMCWVTTLRQVDVDLHGTRGAQSACAERP